MTDRAAKFQLVQTWVFEEGPTLSRSSLVPGLLFHTEAWARRKADLMADADCREGGDGLFRVIAAGDPSWRPLAGPAVWPCAYDCEVPF